MKSLLSFLCILVLFSCQTGKGTPIVSDNPGEWTENPNDSRYVTYYFDFLQDYLKEPMPDVLPLTVEKAYVLQEDDTKLLLICRYSDRGKESWLKATLLINEEGEVRGKEIVASYQINLLESEL